MEGFVGNASVKLGGRAAGGYCGLRRNADGLSVAPRPIGASTGAATVEMKIFDWKKRGETGESGSCTAFLLGMRCWVSCS
mmetsp:Transcript_34211/g.133999  ORF Transcript_34211/g.133999 Transcript_34211/m.133999 type:complete len:80 (+) Transcript_34211:70-309(+)